MKLEISINRNDGPSTERLIKEFDRKLRDTKQFFPYDDFIMEVEARFNILFNNVPTALDLLEKAHELNPASPFITSRLVAILGKENNNNVKISKVLERSIKHLPGDKDINYLYAQYLISTDPDDYISIIHYLSKSYTQGDNRHYAQFLHARYLFLNGDASKSKGLFKTLSGLAIDPEIKNKVGMPINEGGSLKTFTGVVKTKEYNYGFIRRELYGDDIFFYRPDEPVFPIRYDDKVSFNIAFNYKGLVAINLQKINAPI